MRRSRARDEAGFTLIELLIVIVILGVLAAIVVFAVGGITDRGNTSACKADSKTIETAIEAYRAKYNADPPSLTSLVNSNLLHEDANITATTKTGEGYTLTYSSGDLTDCDTALAAGGSPGGGGGPTATPSATPSVSTVTVNNASVASSGSFQTLTINGTGFVSGATLSISPALNSTGSPTVVSATQITVTIKATGGNAGAHTMTVTNPDTGSGSGTLTVT